MLVVATANVYNLHNLQCMEAQNFLFDNAKAITSGNLFLNKKKEE